MWTPSLGQEDPLKEEMGAHSSILAWKNPMDRGAKQVTVHEGAESDMTEHACTKQRGKRTRIINLVTKR